MKNAEGRCLLIVDDDAMLRDVIAGHFEDSGLRILQAGDGRQAYQLATSEGVDVVVSDIRMSKGDGVELLDRLRQRDKHQPPVILMTGYADYSSSDLLKRGARAVLQKPFSWNELARLVENCLANEGGEK